jgi:hypothetical protein
MSVKVVAMPKLGIGRDANFFRNHQRPAEGVGSHGSRIMAGLEGPILIFVALRAISMVLHVRGSTSSMSWAH